mgnify:CR=1 FL=1
MLAILSLFLVSMFSSYVSAAGSFDIRQSMDVAIETIRDVSAPVFEALFGDYSTYDFFWTKVLLFIMLLVVIRFVLLKLPQFEKNKGVTMIVSFVVSLIAIRFMSEGDLIRSLFLPYTTLGVAIIVIIPFLIFFYFLHVTNMGPGGRKMSWIFFMVVFAVLWWNRSAQLSPIGNQIYFWSLIGMIIVMFFDKQIHEYFGLAEDAEYRRHRLRLRIAEIEGQLRRIDPDASRESKKVWEDLDEKLRNLRRNLASI